MIFSSDPSGFTDIGSPLGIVWYLLAAIGLWRMLEKAGQPGWGALIPIYNLYLVIKLGGSSGLVILLFLIPIVNIFAGLYVAGRVSAAFGHGALMAIVGLFFLTPVGLLVLGFDSSRYLPAGRDAMA